MDDRHGEARLVGEALQLTFPQTNACAVVAAAIGGDQQTRRMGIAGLAEPLPPATDALDGECRGVGVDADIDLTLVGGDVVDPIGRDLPQSLDFEVVDADRLRLALAAQLSTAVFEVAHQFLFLRVDRDCRWPAASAAFTLALMYSNCALRSGCCVPSRVLRLARQL